MTSPTRRPRAHLMPVHLVVALLVAVGLLTALPSSATAASGRLTVKPVIAGERTTATGAVPVRAKKSRTVVLQRRTGSHWSTVTRARTTRKGTFTLRHTQRAASTSYRVVAPRAGAARRSVTPSRTSRPVPQKGTLSVPTGARPGTTFEVVARFSPARSGRPVSIQRLVGSTWRTVESGKQSSKGGFRGVVGAPSERGPLRLRAVTSARAGARALTTPVVTMTVDQPDIVSRGDDSSPSGSGIDRVLSDHDGSTVAFVAPTEAGTGLFVRDTRAGRTLEVPAPPRPPNTSSSVEAAALSDDGDRAVFAVGHMPRGGSSSDLRHDVWLWERGAASLTLLSGRADGTPTASTSRGAVLSPNGRHVAFQSTDSAVTGTTGNQAVHVDLTTGTRRTVPAGAASPSALRVDDSGTVGFLTPSRLVPEDTDDLSDIYLSPVAGGVRLASAGARSVVRAWDMDRSGTRIVWNEPGALMVSTAGRVSRLGEEQQGVELSSDGSVAVTTTYLSMDGQTVSHALAHRLADGRQTLYSRPFPGKTIASPVWKPVVSGDGRIGYFVSGAADYTALNEDGPVQALAATLRF